MCSVFQHKLSSTFFFQKFLDQHFSPHFWQMIDEKHAIAMIGLMQKRAGSIALGVLFKQLALFVLGAKPCFHRADDDRRNFADRKTAFLTRLFAVDVDDRRIGRDELDPFAIHYKKTQVEPYLRCREADSFGVIHRLEHVVAEFCQLVVKRGDRLTGRRQNRFGILSVLIAIWSIAV